MNAKTTIRKFLFISIWLVIGGGLLTLLIAAIGRKHRESCSDFQITLRGAEKILFLDAKEIEQLLISVIGGPIKGQPISSFKLHQLEQHLKENTWIKDAELYFTNRDVLQVIITERGPIARIFTNTGRSFYMDSLGRIMPLPQRARARVPVFTGFPEKNVLSLKDSLLLQNIRKAATYIIKDSFWMAQVSQVDITQQSCFEMIPLVGNHVVRLGNGENMEEKFHRLFVFYQQVLSKTGFDKYKFVDVQYEGQVVASRQSNNAKVDSIQMRKNIEKLMKQAEEDAIAATEASIPKLTVGIDSSKLNKTTKQ